jgi:hypothetical protein
VRCSGTAADSPTRTLDDDPAPASGGRTLLERGTARIGPGDPRATGAHRPLGGPSAERAPAGPPGTGPTHIARSSPPGSDEHVAHQSTRPHCATGPTHRTTPGHRVAALQGGIAHDVVRMPCRCACSSPAKQGLRHHIGSTSESHLRTTGTDPCGPVRAQVRRTIRKLILRNCAEPCQPADAILFSPTESAFPVQGSFRWRRAHRGACRALVRSRCRSGARPPGLSTHHGTGTHPSRAVPRCRGIADPLPVERATVMPTTQL